MTDGEHVRDLLRSAFPPASTRDPVRDLWPLVVTRIHAPVERSWFDIGLAALVVVLLVMFPKWLLLLAYHF